jgi:hypothetical protein
MKIHQNAARIKQVALAPGFSGMASQAQAHASEQGFVLLLPTEIYITSGVASVVLTVLLLLVLPERMLAAVFRPLSISWRRATHAPLVTSCATFLLLGFLVWVGQNGPRDPLANPLVLTVWTVWWIGFVSLQGLFGDLWRWVNPWTGPVALTRSLLGVRPFLRLPVWLGHAPAIVSFLGFAAIVMADPAPTDPARLASYVGIYWLLTYLARLAFGPRWAFRGEGISMLMRLYAKVGLFATGGRRLRAGVFGWQVLRGPVPPFGVAVFCVIMLGSGSFDGLNETFWWLAQLGVNPLEFPGRSAVVWPNLIGLLIANAALVAVFAISVWLGLKLAKADMSLPLAFRVFAPSILPIALGYHIAHYYTSFLVDGQYALAAASDPMATGQDLLGLGTFYVTTGFFNTQASVRAIFLVQAGAVVIGHVLAILLAHAIAVQNFGTNRRAALSQAPLALFMILYTLFGLWLLASPRGV